MFQIVKNFTCCENNTANAYNNFETRYVKKLGLKDDNNEMMDILDNKLYSNAVKDMFVTQTVLVSHFDCVELLLHSVDCSYVYVSYDVNNEIIGVVGFNFIGEDAKKVQIDKWFVVGDYNRRKFQKEFVKLMTSLNVTEVYNLKWYNCGDDSDLWYPHKAIYDHSVGRFVSVRDASGNRICVGKPLRINPKY